jgi:hypothetical protein
MNLSRASVDPTKYDLQSVVEHEVDEALGFSSALNGLLNGAPPPSTPARALDLFRFDQSGARSFNTATNTAAYLSIDGGATRLVRFNQTQNADFQDWYSGNGQTPHVQDAFGTPGATANLSVELIALDVCGYNLVYAMPQPTILSMWPSGGMMNVTWASQPNLSYQMQSKTNMMGTWFNVGNPVTANGSTTSAAAPMNSAQSFYRVVLQSGGQSLAIKGSIANRATASMSRQSAAMHLPEQSHANAAD